MNDFETIIDFGTKNIRLAIFNNSSKKIYSSQITNTDPFESNNSETSLNKLIRDAERELSMHIDYVDVLYDSTKLKFIDFSIKKSFDQPTLLKKIYDNLIEEANFIIKENYFKDQIIHLIVSKIIIDDNKEIEIVTDETKTKSIILEIKFLCLSKSKIINLSNKFKKNNLNISNIFSSSYVKTTQYKNNLEIGKNYIFLDIGFERSSSWFFLNNKFIYFNSIPFGGNTITKDISKVLKLNIDYSEDLKIDFNTVEDNINNKNTLNNRNQYSEILNKKISVKILKQILEARVDEIIELVVNKNDYLTKKYFLEKPSIIFTGSGSKAVSNMLNLETRNIFSNFIFLQETDSMICKAGFNYNKTKESRLIFPKDKSKKVGFFEGFFNFFSK